MIPALAAPFVLLALDPAVAPPADVVAVEVTYSTRVGEGAAGRKHLGRDGCYQVEGEGGTGGAGRARDSQAGCHHAADVAAAFARIAKVAETSRAAPERARGPAGGAAMDSSLPGKRDRMVIVLRNGTRLIPSDQDAANALAAAVNELPSENQWYAKPPASPVGKGAQLIVLSVSAASEGGPRRLEAALAADGRWWCHRSMPARAGDEPQLPGKRAKPLASAEASARLARIAAGLRAAGAADDDASRDPPGGIERSIEIAFPGGPRSRALPKQQAAAVAGRFAAEMRPASSACALP
jgi:hypothetical protein